MKHGRATATTTSSSSAAAPAAARSPAQLAPSGKRILILERGDWLPREKENWDSERGLRQEPLRVQGDLVRRGRQAVPAGRPLLRRRRDQAVRRRAVPAARRRTSASSSTTTASRRPGPSAYDELEPYYTQAEQLYEVHGARGEDPTEPPASAPYPFPARHPRAAHPAALRRPGARRATTRSTRRAASARRGRPCRTARASAAHLRRLPVPRPRQVGRRDDRRPARARSTPT